jgi:hypothetical protein
MRKISTDIFFCERKFIKEAINEYISDIRAYGGVDCKNYVTFYGNNLDKEDTPEKDAFRVFYVKRIKGSMEVRVIVNNYWKIKEK